RLSGIEEHLGLEHETVADDANVRAVAQNGAQPAKEFRTVARQFLHPLRQCDIEALAEIGYPPLRFLVALFRSLERSFQRRELSAQRADLLVQHLDLRQRARGYAFFRFERLVELGGFTRGIIAGAGEAFVEAL